MISIVWNTIDITNEGNMFATLNFLPHIKFTPTQKIKIEPVNDKFTIACSVNKGNIKNLNVHSLIPNQYRTIGIAYSRDNINLKISELFINYLCQINRLSTLS